MRGLGLLTICWILITPSPLYGDGGTGPTVGGGDTPAASGAPTPEQAGAQAAEEARLGRTSQQQVGRIAANAGYSATTPQEQAEARALQAELAAMGADEFRKFTSGMPEAVVARLEKERRLGSQSPASAPSVAPSQPVAQPQQAGQGAAAPQQDPNAKNEQTPQTAKAPEAAKAEKSESKTGELKGGEVPQPKENSAGNAFLAQVLANQPGGSDSDGLATLAAAVAAMQASGKPTAAQTGGASAQSIVDGILNLGNSQGQVAATNRGTNAPVSAGGSSYGQAVAPGDRLLGSLNAPARAIAKPKKKTLEQEFLEAHAQGVAAAGSEQPASTEGGRVRVFDGGYGGGNEGGGSVNPRSGGGVIVPASGHRGAGE